MLQAEGAGEGREGDAGGEIDGILGSLSNKEAVSVCLDLAVIWKTKEP